jgi:Flp pilus assembly protein TadG
MKNKSGQSFVEFMLLLPVLVLMTLGLLDFGRAYFVLVMLNDAAAEGAVYAGAYPTNTNEIKLRVTESAADALIEIGATDVTVLYNTIEVGKSITVTVSYDFTFLTPLIGDMFGDGLTLQGQAVNPIISSL